MTSTNAGRPPMAFGDENGVSAMMARIAGMAGKYRRMAGIGPVRPDQAGLSKSGYTSADQVRADLAKMGIIKAEPEPAPPVLPPPAKAERKLAVAERVRLILQTLKPGHRFCYRDMQRLTLAHSKTLSAQLAAHVKAGVLERDPCGRGMFILRDASKITQPRTWKPRKE